MTLWVILVLVVFGTLFYRYYLSRLDQRLSKIESRHEKEIKELEDKNTNVLQNVNKELLLSNEYSVSEASERARKAHVEVDKWLDDTEKKINKSLGEKNEIIEKFQSDIHLKIDNAKKCLHQANDSIGTGDTKQGAAHLRDVRSSVDDIQRSSWFHHKPGSIRLGAFSSKEPVVIPGEFHSAATAPYMMESKVYFIVSQN